MWQFVASGLLGKAAFSMGAAGVLCGILFHFSIMSLFSTFAFLVCWKLSIVDERWALLAGLVYGAGMWFVMNMLVVPLSRAGSGVVPVFKIEMIMHIGFPHMIFGAVIVLVIRRGIARSL